MAGRFSKTARPKRPGAYVNFVSRPPEPVLANTVGTVVVPFTHTWGPPNQIIQLQSFGDFISVYGQGGTIPPTYTPGYQAVHDAFRGEGIPGFGGAGTVLGYRMAGSGAAQSSHALTNTTPVTAITVKAIYPGSFGDHLSVSVIADSADPTNTANLVVYLDGVEVERFAYAKTNITDLVAQIDGTGVYAGRASDWLRTSGSAVSGVALTVVSSPVSLTGGNDGSTLIAGDWTALMTAAEPYRFSLFAGQNLTDSTILASLKVWADNLNTRGKRFLTVVGGGTTGVPDTMTAAITRSGTLNDSDFVNLGGGVYTDDQFGDLNPSQLVSRVAGIFASRGETQAVTFARLAGLSIKVGVTEADILAGLDGGVTAISRDSNAVAPVRIELGLTTYTTKTDVTKPYAIYHDPKFVRTMHGLETELTEFAESNVIGRMPVNAGTRDYLRGQMELRLKTREVAGVILPGWSVQVAQDPPPSDLDNFVALDYQILFGRSLDQVLNTVTVG